MVLTYSGLCIDSKLYVKLPRVGYPFFVVASRPTIQLRRVGTSGFRTGGRLCETFPSVVTVPAAGNVKESMGVAVAAGTSPLRASKNGTMRGMVNELPTDVTLHVRGALFDMDGVLVNSTGSDERCWLRWAQLHGMEAVSRFFPHTEDALSIRFVRFGPILIRMLSSGGWRTLMRRTEWILRAARCHSTPCSASSALMGDCHLCSGAFG